MGERRGEGIKVNTLGYIRLGKATHTWLHEAGEGYTHLAT